MSYRRSPLKEKPLRIPGQSLDEEIQNVENDQVTTYALIATLSIALTLYSWFLYLIKIPSPPLLLTVGCVVVTLYSTHRIMKAKKYIENLTLGRDGERIVAETLDELRQEGAVIFHDILGDGFNIDHTVLTKHGIYVVETKTRSKRSNSRVKYDGKRLFIDGKSPDRDPLVQVTGLANWLRTELQKSTGKLFPIQPVVVFPGWFVESLDQAKSGAVWVLNPKALPAFIKHEPENIRDDDLRLAAYHLARLIRSR